VSEAECGVVTTGVRLRLAELGTADPVRPILADSRERIDLFRSVSLKPNLRECQEAMRRRQDFHFEEILNPVLWLARQAKRPVFCTAGEVGIMVADPEG